MNNSISKKLVLDHSNMRLRVGDVVKHFKRENLNEYDDQLKYLYKILYCGFDTTNHIEIVVYVPLYDTEYDVFVRSVDEFFAKVDKKKYPEIQQDYVFEKV